MPLRKKIKKFILNKIFGEFIGFLTGLWAAGLVSVFFERRSFANLWGLLAQKPVVDDRVFVGLQWIVAAIFGFIVLEFVNNFIGPRKEIIIACLEKFEAVIKTELRGLLEREKRSNNL